MNRPSKQPTSASRDLFGKDDRMSKSAFRLLPSRGDATLDRITWDPIATFSRRIDSERSFSWLIFLAHPSGLPALQKSVDVHCQKSIVPSCPVGANSADMAARKARHPRDQSQ